jgi:hypothetical protein
MRVALVVVFVSVLTTSSEASKSCMTKTEARQHFGSVHIYWHGKDHCWDVTPIRRHRQAHRVQKTRKAEQIRKVQRKVDRPSWYDSMSKMLPDEKPAEKPAEESAKTSWADRWVDIEPAQRPRVNIAAVAPPTVIERRPEPMLTPRGVVMALIGIALTLAIVELLFGGVKSGGRRYQRN